MRGKLVVVIGLISVAALLGFSAVVVSASSPRVSVSPQQQAPFHVLRPQILPAGTVMVAENVTRNPDGTTDVDLHYKLANGQRLHIWQTDRSATSLGVKNPLQDGQVVKRKSVEWIVAPGFSGRVLTANAQIGALIVSLDAPLATAGLLEVADSLR